jgi:hypothetical protein
MNPAVDEVRDRAQGEAYVEAVKAGVAPHPDSPSGRSLLASYSRWAAREQEQNQGVRILADLASQLAAAEKALVEARSMISKASTSTAIATPEVREETAQQLASGAIRGALLAGSAVPTALTQGYKVYKQKSGRLTEAAWRKSIR